jgi:hypothetical protein
MLRVSFSAFKEKTNRGARLNVLGIQLLVKLWACKKQKINDPDCLEKLCPKPQKAPDL